MGVLHTSLLFAKVIARYWDVRIFESSFDLSFNEEEMALSELERVIS